VVEVVKVKDTDTGGKPTLLNEPILLDYNYGLGFKVAGKDVIKRNHDITPIKEPITNSFNSFTENIPF
jgi:hypothetical protein